jgi:hypothetical protein
MVNINRRIYTKCAKCGQDKDHDNNYVHGECMYPKRLGGFFYCAVCGKYWGVESRNYVCMDDLANKPVTT